jgi:hypothetical protein
MKSEMMEFMLYISGYTSDFEVLHMRSPTGETVLNPRPLHPHGPGYATHPELSRPVYAAASAYAFHNPYVAGIGVSAVPAVVAVMATSAYPEVAGPQYQSAMSGQMSIGSSALNMPRVESWTDFFSWSYWSGN